MKKINDCVGKERLKIYIAQGFIYIDIKRKRSLYKHATAQAFIHEPFGFGSSPQFTHVPVYVYVVEEETQLDRTQS